MRICCAVVTLLLAPVLFAQRAPDPISSLKRVVVPVPPGLATYVRDQAALVTLGKALFWDLQVGSDGKTACASCHFHAGGDHRIQNQLSNPLGAFQANYKLTGGDFPFHQLADPGNNASRVLRDSTQRAGSAGVFNRKLTGVIPGLSFEDASDVADASFRSGGLNVRQVTGRNAPSAINAVFNFRNFWDGRASETFTGPTPFGLSDARANLLTAASGGLQPETLRLQNSSLASQAVGPVLNGAEMSYGSRSWPLVGKKMLALRPLAYQKIATDDSVLGPLANPSGRGFRAAVTYLDLVKNAFQGIYWNSQQLTDDSGNVAPTGAFTQAEFNFWMFFGLAVQAYEATLVADDSRVDRMADGQMMGQQMMGLLSPTEMEGMQLFIGRTGCNACHAGAELTLATHSGVNGNDLLKSGRDTGFFRVGVRPSEEDLGIGGLDGLNKPLASTFPTGNAPGIAAGRFKTPGLRNVEFTGPYFHDGSQATLEQVVQFYNRGGDFPPNPSNGPNILPRALSAAEQAQIVAFLKALTDDRVRFERAPFDHPELCVADGHTARANGNPAAPLSAAERWVGLPPVGRGGSNVPLQTFDELLAGTGVDGSRAHNMSEPCGIEALTATGFVNANAASFRTSVVAQSSIVTAVGTGLTAGTASATTNPAPTTLGGAAVVVRDSAGVARNAPLFYVSPTQINYAVPEGTAPGAATVNVTGSATPFQTQLQIATVSPGIFGVQGLAAANVLRVRGGEQTVGEVVRLDTGGNLALAPIDLGPADQQTFLILYGTGIRNANPVTVSIGNVLVTAAFAGAQGTFAGEDQINVLLPQTLRGAGVVDVTLNVDGQVANRVKIQIQ
jgi:uncharacterized protein (TIGR03437 family)